MILGTAGYLSPEQARGRPVHRRCDVFAFGCILFEMLAGEPVFGGETASDSIGAALHKEPDFTLLPRNTPPTVQHLLRRCLTKDRRRRLQSIGDARVELEDALSGHAPIDPAAPASQRRNHALAALPWAACAVLVLAMVALLFGRDGDETTSPMIRGSPGARPGSSFAASTTTPPSATSITTWGWSAMSS